MAKQLLIKICGLTDPADAEQAARLGVEAIGLNFYERSPRFVDPARAAAILGALPPAVEAVAVFVHQQLRPALELVRRLERIQTLQWHGEDREPDSPETYRLIPAFRVRDCASLEEIRRFLEQLSACGVVPAAVLADAHVPGQPGGTGQTAPWELLADFRPGVPLYLAGGLTPENVAEAVHVVRPDAVDVASGVESRPGRKDLERMRRFVANAREAAARFY
jgi:phosphoribosylanthranilate isomerase